MWKPNGHYIIIKAADVTETDEVLRGAKEAGIILQEEELNREQASSTVGTLISVGDQAWLAFGPNNDGKPWAEVGDKVCYPRHTGNTIKDPETGEEYILMTDERVLATYKGEE